MDYFLIYINSLQLLAPNLTVIYLFVVVKRVPVVTMTGS